MASFTAFHKGYTCVTYSLGVVYFANESKHTKKKGIYGHSGGNNSETNSELEG